VLWRTEIVESAWGDAAYKHYASPGDGVRTDGFLCNECALPQDCTGACCNSCRSQNGICYTLFRERVARDPRCCRHGAEELELCNIDRECTTVLFFAHNLSRT
jgi:hypothetical protein